MKLHRRKEFMFRRWELAERRDRSESNGATSTHAYTQTFSAGFFFIDSLKSRFMISKHIFWPWLQPQHQTHDSVVEHPKTSLIYTRRVPGEEMSHWDIIWHSLQCWIQSHYNWKSRRKFVRKRTHKGGTRTHCVNLLPVMVVQICHCIERFIHS